MRLLNFLMLAGRVKQFHSSLICPIPLCYAIIMIEKVTYIDVLKCVFPSESHEFKEARIMNAHEDTLHSIKVSLFNETGHKITT